MLCIQLACFHRDASRHLVKAARECHDMSTDASSVCSQAQSKGESMIQMTRDIQQDLRDGFSGKNLDASVFIKINDLIENKKMTEALGFLKEMDGMASKIVGQADEMQLALTRGLDSLPEDVKEDYNQNNNNNPAAKRNDTEDNYRAMAPTEDETTGHTREMGVGGGDDEGTLELEKLLNVDHDISELENSCTQSRGGGLNLFTAGSMGTQVLEQTAGKGQVCRSLLLQMQQVFGTVARLSQAIFSSNSNCCALAHSLAASVASLFQCRRLVDLLSKAAAALVRLVKAIGQLIETVWERVQGFVQEFGAAKKVGRFVAGIQQSKVGQLATSLTNAKNSKAGKMASSLLAPFRPNKAS